MGLHSYQARQEQPNSPAVYERHRPETTLLYQIVHEYWPEFQAELASHGKSKKTQSLDETDQSPAERRVSMTWAQRLKRVFDIDIETCSECGGDVRIIACIEDPVVIQKILDHMDQNVSLRQVVSVPECRAPPAMRLFI